MKEKTFINTKFIFPFILIFFYSISVNSQEIHKFRANSLGVKFLLKDGNWDDSLGWVDVNSLIVHNQENQRITIYGEPNYIFDIISTTESIDDAGNTILAMKCINQNQKECVFKMSYDKNYNMQFYIYYAESILIYNVKLLK